MLKNIGNADRLIRISLALLIVILYLAGSITGSAAVILGIVAVLFLITGALLVFVLLIYFLR